MAIEAARALLDNSYFNAKRYDLAKVGRYKINRKLGIDAPITDSVLTLEDVVFRRTGIGTLGDPGADVIARIAAIMAAELRWSADETARQTAAVTAHFQWGKTA